MDIATQAAWLFDYSLGSLGRIELTIGGILHLLCLAMVVRDTVRVFRIRRQSQAASHGLELLFLGILTLALAGVLAGGSLWILTVTAWIVAASTMFVVVIGRASAEANPPC